MSDFGPPRYDMDDWLESHLFDRRVIMIRGPLDGDVATRTASKLMTLDATGDSPIGIQLDSPGGSLEAAFAVVDVIDALGVATELTCLGRVEGTAVAIAAVCTKRVAMPHTRFLFADPEIFVEAQAREIEHLVEHHKRALDRYHARLSEAMGRSKSDVEEMCRTKRFMDAYEALAIGLIDEVSAPKRTALRSIGDRRPPGLKKR